MIECRLHRNYDCLRAKHAKKSLQPVSSLGKGCHCKLRFMCFSYIAPAERSAAKRAEVGKLLPHEPQIRKRQGEDQVEHHCGPA